MSKDKSNSNADTHNQMEGDGGLCCTQCGLKYPLESHDSEGRIVFGPLVLNECRWTRYGEEGGEPPGLLFCTARCLIEFLGNPANHGQVRWFTTAYLRASLYLEPCDDFLWPGPRTAEEESRKLTGPYIILKGPYGSLFHDISLPTFLLSIEQVILALSREEEWFLREGYEIRPWYASYPEAEQTP